MHHQTMEGEYGRIPPVSDLTRPRLYHVPPRALPSGDARDAFFARIAALGFDTLLLGWPFPVEPHSWFATRTLDTLASPFDGQKPEDAFRRLAGAAAARGLAVFMDFACTQAGDGDLLSALPGCWSGAATAGDPRVSPATAGHGVTLADEAAAARFTDFWAGHLDRWRRAGISGVRCHAAGALPAEVWQRLLGPARDAGLLALGWTPGLPRERVRELAGAFDFVTASSAWWDGRAPWLVEEFNALRSHARLIGFSDDPFGPRLAVRGPDATAEARHRLALAAAAQLADGWLMPMGFEHGARAPFTEADAELGDAAGLDLSAEIAALNAAPVAVRRLRQLTSPGAAATLVKADGADGARLLAFNPDLDHPAPLSAREATARLGLALAGTVPDELPPGGTAAIDLATTPPILAPRPAVAPFTSAPRIAIERVTPSVDGGRFAVKRCVGDVVTVEADIFADGHELLAAELRWRAADEKTWQRAPLVPTVNDRWQARFPLLRVGRHDFLIEAWWDHFGTFRRDLGKKRAAGQKLAVEVSEGRALLEEALERAPKGPRGVIRDHLRRLKDSEAAAVEALLSPSLAAAMAEADPRAFATGATQLYPIECDREAARFASWYELFPRSVTDDATRHGTLRDVIGRLPAIRDMGFDVLYFPPIHPIGRSHRKGRNNALEAGPDDPGSPYAIGAEAGGHEAIHPELGTFDDFRALVAAARAEGLEIALDFAVQCSPDHPWLKAHPDWFQWRPDGTIRYAENPPKKYEDIVNVDFYAKGAVPDLWLALRDVVESWVRLGVRIFRVDNPHTKPFPFWEWLIADIRSRDPSVIFLAEAFTRPKLMYRLGKIGFSQSYTYFTWRNTKAELRDYLEELNRVPARDVYRPHFFVNTPDINPYFLQRSGRPGFLIRAALASMLSGLWGLYSGFELCEAAPVPGKEEYLDSEKYEIRPRDYSGPGNIVAEITRLNAIRRAHPALQSHLNVTFYNAFDEQILCFGKRLPGEDEMVLVAVSLDPHAPRNAAIEVPLWEFGLPDHAAVEVEDLLRDTRFTWTGKMQTIHLDPADLPYAIWRIRPVGGVA
ncbi:alpha-1,4-glucan--maltose-1-phosphate maltosyltransferase [Xanthobacter flavus]|uniref:alpha-1,4-glucan--maltose-1-phosphate maltosyltransferase n=1 Tax=Xanthobacter flavus TaxID=281 RepID=UPI003728064A